MNRRCPALDDDPPGISAECFSSMISAKPRKTEEKPATSDRKSLRTEEKPAVFLRQPADIAEKSAISDAGFVDPEGNSSIFDAGNIDHEGKSSISGLRPGVRLAKPIVHALRGFSH
jgi:hypothetical protein